MLRMNDEAEDRQAYGKGGGLDRVPTGERGEVGGHISAGPGRTTDDSGGPRHRVCGFVAGNGDDIDAVNGVINAVGITFGQFLVDNLGLKWVIATDDEGSDLAVYGLPGKGDLLVYPANFVAKRWERRETNFLESSYRQIAEQVKTLQAGQGSKEKSKPWWKPW